MKALSSVVFFIMIITLGNAQKHDNTWLMGGTCLPSDAHLVSKLEFDKENLIPETIPHIAFFFNPTNASISNASGDLQFFTNGNDIFNWKYEKLENGSNLANLGECGDQRLQQGAIAVPYPEHQNEYVLITINEEFILHEEEIQVFERVYFNVVDMNENKGEGKLVVRQDLIIADTLNIGQGMVCQHANGRDWWLLLFEYDSNDYYSYLINPNGVELVGKNKTSNPVLSGRNQATYSSNGELMAYFNATSTISGIYIDIFNFDRCAGILDGQKKILIEDNTSVGGGGVAFSPNSRFLYVPLELNVYQYDLWADDIEASRVTVAVYDGFIEDDFWTSTFHMAQLAPDDKIYITTPTDGHYLHIIHNPNEKGLACNLEQHALHWPTWKHISIPNFPHYRMGALEGSLCDTIGLVSTPFADFSVENLGDEFSYSFNDLSTSNTSTWFWDFGDGNSSSEQNPSHTYTQYGSYDICLTVSNEAGSNTSCQSICILPAPDMHNILSASSLLLDCSAENQMVDLSTPFYDLNFYQADNWQIEWQGPNGLITEGISQIQVGQAGAYHISIQDSTSNCVLQDSVYIEEGNLSLDFSLSEDLVVLPCLDLVDIELTVDAECFKVTWERSNGDSFTAFNQTSFRFQNAGEYTFSVSLCNNENCEAQQSLVIELEPISALWEADIMGRIVSFTPELNDNILLHFWDFGDGNSETLVNPEHTYADTGRYEVTHKVADGCEWYTYIKEIYITDDITETPIVGFQYQALNEEFTFSFQDTSSAFVNNWFWDFGDGNTSKEQNPNHMFGQFGSYEVCLTATNAIGSNTSCEWICVTPDPTESFISASDSLLNCSNAETGVNLMSSLSASDLFNTDRWDAYWISPDGNILSGNEVQANIAGTFSYIFEDPLSECFFYDTITIRSNFDQIDFSVSASSDSVPCEASFDLFLETDALCFEATIFQDSIPVFVTKESTITLQGAGTYIIEMMHCISACVTSDTIVIFNNDISADFMIEEQEATFSFSSSEMENVSHSWDFGDGNNADIPNPSHSYLASGTYEVTHIVSNACSADTIVKSIEVIISSNQSIVDLSVDVFPNPTSGHLTVLSSDFNLKQVVLVNSLGQTVFDRQVNSERYEMLLNRLPSGVYWLEITLQGDDRAVKKVVIE